MQGSSTLLKTRLDLLRLHRLLLVLDKELEAMTTIMECLAVGNIQVDFRSIVKMENETVVDL